ncbi:hypothetical protein Daus18300_003697 [Diaporthe australafricana]|uniref:Ecp2 effector protein domain-containing protein n=1 Tax=Diaporthe australafricana TaxID=127596 RepID=A0ABR3XFC3_9PEZI
MNFKLSIILVITRAIIITVAMQPSSTTSISSINSTGGNVDSYGCFRSGELWEDLGTDKSIIDAYDQQWCSGAVGFWTLGVRSSRCVPDGKDIGYVSHDVCIGFITQALKLCKKGGILNLLSGPGTDGGDVIGINVMADPQGSLSCYG